MLAIHHPLDDLLAPVSFFHQHPFFHLTAPVERHRLNESESEYTLTLPLPGMRPDDLKLTFDNGVLSIEGETKTAYKQLTASHCLRLPSDVNFEAAKAAAENGVLTVTLPKHHCANHQLVVADANAALPTVAEEDYVITLALPGIRPSDLMITCEEGMLRIDGETKSAHGRLRASHRKRLPLDADFEAATAASEDGILTIQLPKKARTVARELRIGGSSVALADAEMASAPAADAARCD